MDYQSADLRKPAEDALIVEVGKSWVITTSMMHHSEDYYTQLLLEVDTNPDASQTNFWNVNTYRLDAEGYIDELINDTVEIDNLPEALTNYGWHLDLYYGKTIEETQ
jgi:hypothetical protein